MIEGLFSYIDDDGEGFVIKPAGDPSQFLILTADDPDGGLVAVWIPREQAVKLRDYLTGVLDA